MIDEMNMRKLNPRTQIGYLRAVDKLAKYLKHSPEQATSGELRGFQIALDEQGASNFTMNRTITGLQFLFAKTLDRPDIVRKRQKGQISDTISRTVGVFMQLV